VTGEPLLAPSHVEGQEPEGIPSDHQRPGADDRQSDPPSLGLLPAHARPADTLGLPPAPEAATAPAGSAGAFQEAIVQPDLRLTSPGFRFAQLKEELVAWVKTLLSAAVYAVLIVTFGFQVARVEGQSMAPTLEDQDRLIVNKLVYRIGEPRRGDIVMLYYPLNPDKSFVKRVIAEEGDTVRIVDGRVYVNDIPLKDDYVSSEYRSHDDWGPQVIPEGYYFVMGDHRNNSSDSRHWGMVPKRYIIGKVQLRWWPVPTARVF
jgi:signal peptidase I